MGSEVLPPTDESVGESQSQELAIGPAPGTLFRTDDPVEIIARATDVAKALSEVLRDQGLTVNIKGREHVRVEGWTLCGTMLGVFPVVEWTRPVEQGWEARVQAVTRDGAVVGAAEAECLRSEGKPWNSRDDYALRSMAQTRAISKAMRAPLGFIISLAGFDPTPESEIPRGETQPARPFDPDQDLLTGAISGQDAPRVIAEALNGLDGTVDWQELIHTVVRTHYEHAGTDEWRELPPDDQKDFWRRLSNATFKMQELSPPGSMPPITDKQIIECISYAFGGIYLAEVPYVEPAIPEPEDIPFGE